MADFQAWLACYISHASCRHHLLSGAATTPIKNPSATHFIKLTLCDPFLGLICYINQLIYQFNEDLILSMKGEKILCAGVLYEYMYNK